MSTGRESGAHHELASEIWRLCFGANTRGRRRTALDLHTLRAAGLHSSVPMRSEAPLRVQEVARSSLCTCIQ
jgi:hypothetical protein